MGCLRLENIENQPLLSVLNGENALDVKTDVSAYRYGNNGMERDDEVKGKGNNLSFKFRMFDPRVGRFLSIDPLADSYPFSSPYIFAENNVIRSIDLEGLEQLIMNVTADPNSISGEPGKAVIVIKKDFMVVTSGIGAVPNYHNISPKEYTNKYKKGNTTMFMSKLPSAKEEAVFLDGKQERLARKAMKGNSKAAAKLEGIDYYIVDISYDYNITVQSETNLLDALAWVDEDPALRGIVYSPTIDLSELIKQDLGDYRATIDQGIKQQLLSHNFYALNRMSRSGGVNAGGVGSTSALYSYDFVAINGEHMKHPTSAFKLPILNGSAVPEYTYNETEDVVHEVGHSSTNKAHVSGNGYNYGDTGLSSNIHGKIYPTSKNTKDILDSNRGTLNK